jgi:hypothetical protein
MQSAPQAGLRKTVVLVTHDVEEAIRVGDLVAVYRPGGHLAQVDTPERLLAFPADDYVERFIGLDRGIRRLSFFPADGHEAVLGEQATIAEALPVALICGMRGRGATRARSGPTACLCERSSPRDRNPGLRLLVLAFRRGQSRRAAGFGRLPRASGRTGTGAS